MAMLKMSFGKASGKAWMNTLICCLLIRQQLRNLLRICLNKFPKSSNIWGTMFLQKKSVLRII